MMRLKKTYNAKACTWAGFIAIAVIAGVCGLIVFANAGRAQTVAANQKEKTKTQAKTAKSTADTAIRPFHVSFPQDQLDDLRWRVKATKFPERETVDNDTQGARLATVQALAKYWATDYDWRKIEAKLNSYPQFVTNIDGLDIQGIQMTTNRLRSIVLSLFGLVLILGSADLICTAQELGYESRFANVNGVRIHYLKAGTGTKALVLVHGFGDNAHMWIPLFNDFGGEYTIIAPDLRGLGESSRPATGYDKKTAAVDIHELVKSLGYKQIDLVGHDIGLMVAYAYAAQFPTEVRKLALLDAPIPGVGEVWEGIYTNPARRHFHFVKSPIALDLVKGRERLFLEHFWQTRSANPKKPTEADRRMYAASYAQPGVMRDAFEYFRAFNDQDAADNRNFAKTKLPMPLLLITGEKAMGPALEQQAKLVSDNYRSIILKDTGHWLMDERPAETGAALKDFFEK